MSEPLSSVHDEIDADRLLSTEEVARLLGCSPATLVDQRWLGTGPPFVKLSHCCVRYFRSDVLAYARERVTRSTADPRIKDLLRAEAETARKRKSRKRQR